MLGLTLPPTLGSRTYAAVVEGCLRGFHNALVSYDESRQSPNYWDNPLRRRVRMVVWHISEGGFTGTMEWLCNPESEASSNDVINRDGRVWNIVPGHKAPWTNGILRNPNRFQAVIASLEASGTNPNWASYTIECVGTSGQGHSGSLSQLQVAALILRTAQAAVEYGLSVDQQHVVRHSDIDSVTRSNCPGYAPWEMVAWRDAAKAVAAAWRGW